MPIIIDNIEMLYHAGLEMSVKFQEVEELRICRQSTHEGGKVDNPKHRPPLPPGKITLVLISVRG